MEFFIKRAGVIAGVVHDAVDNLRRNSKTRQQRSGSAKKECKRDRVLANGQLINGLLRPGRRIGHGGLKSGSLRCTEASSNRRSFGWLRLLAAGMPD
ncbi:MAG: hypothetical protein ABI992_00180 [Chthoniobacterales bacterium]